MSHPPNGVRQRRQVQTRERLLDAAKTVFAQRGFDAATVPEIAQEAGLSTGAIYSNFAGKEDLFLSMVGRAVTAGAQQRARATERAADGRVLAATLADDWTRRVDADPELILLVAEFWSFALRRPELRPVLQGFFRTVRGNLEETVNQGFPSLATTEAGRVARVMHALAYGYAIQRVADPEAAQPADLRWAVTRLLDLDVYDDG